MRCLNSDGNYRTATWKIFTANCPKQNMACGSNTKTRAYVAAITTCYLRLW